MGHTAVSAAEASSVTLYLRFDNRATGSQSELLLFCTFTSLL